MKEIIAFLTKMNKTISTMESATGGYLASSITNIDGSSLVFKFGAVTYSNEFKIKMGVAKDVIDEYSVYSIETSHEMSKKITEFTNSDYGVGITGKINRVDPFNNFGDDSTIFLSVYDKKKDIYLDSTIKAIKETRLENKELVLEEFIKLFKTIIKES
ncbi:MAG: nicotinamide-nucleotide amidohydrolase family protein [Erysipelotrichaceae bacterium]|nr:nicotinamide-nucleotide amidohydrolase family protein [Erysipelotrichaceae bacterium]